MAKRGAFIVIEGLDRSGKSTQAQRLSDYLQKTTGNAKLVKFPDRTTPIGKMIDAYLRSQSDLDDRAIHLLFSANRWECASAIEQALLQGTSIICDRYAFSGIAFSASKTAFNAGSSVQEPLLAYEWCRAPDVSLPAPDIVLFLDISPEVARQRGGYGEERYEKEEMQMRVREVFRRIEKEMNEEGKVKWRTLDASGSLEGVEETIKASVGDFCNGVVGDIQRLWV
ncbi:Thymidylate kinase [Serendipita sp. 400]|nr:Thymidylate kinase [Serendipita sp. 400]